jgi:geranylgeranyl diphosphate synthase, type II
VDVKRFIAEKRALVESALNASFSFTPGTSKILKDAMEYSLFSEGKRIRPVLAIAACEAMNGKTEDVLPFAVAIEMIHTYSLIHDDLPCMDNDDLRRGRPTCHKVFGEAVALLAGDALLTEAFRVMAQRGNASVSAATARRVMFEVASAAGASGMVGGQTMDIVSEGKKSNKRMLSYIHRNKTSALIRASIVAGALVGRAKQIQLKGFRTYGEAIGLAFQIKDDLLDVEGVEAEVGKKLNKDSEKQTYVKHYGIAASKARIDELIGKATESLAFLGPKGDTLVRIATFVGSRSR